MAAATSTVFGGSGYTDCSDSTVWAIPTSSNTQMKELRDYISWYTRDHLTHTDPKLSVLTSSIRPDSSYNFDASAVCNITNICQLGSALFELDILLVSFTSAKVLELRSLLGTEIGALEDGQSGRAYIATSSWQLLHNASSNDIMTLLTDASHTAAASPRVDLTVQLDADVPSAFHEDAGREVVLFSRKHTAFALVDKVVSIERLLILKFNPRGAGFLSGKCFAFSSD
ncbi:hypothetical protein V1520DRAFT_368981 [Lipomyces starkeyi]|uniref:Uncharacterized protein n=1 Tax=Lipomyces starkeyi NRRL Y-11557 TaxID=675824 RepID=A0A1E3QCB8_LIPST|nr:hypothetical protein LIPSTDRAFT_25879 [Lipomyces starkeyi NRRL Y-11557]